MNIFGNQSNFVKLITPKMATFNDYEVLGIMGTDLSSTCYKVRHKISNELYVWKAINYEQLDLSLKEVIQRINDRKNSTRNLQLSLHDFIRHEETKTVYLVTEYCKHGSLLDLTQKCKKSGNYLHEDFIWSVLYKLACFCKVNKSAIGEINFNLHEIFVDEKFDLKFFNFNLGNFSKVEKQSDLFNLNNVLQQMVYLKSNKFPEYYSSELKNLVEFLLEPRDGITPTIDAVLCHPTALTKINLQIHSIFVNNPGSPISGLIAEEIAKKGDAEFSNKENLEHLLRTKLDNLKDREANLRKQEEKLRQQVLELDKREKKIILNERSAREKMMKAELYLKRARDARTSVVGSSKGSCLTKKELIENIDFSYSPECGDSSILPKTSCKLNIRDLHKPPKFNRTLSERRVRFKPHSPLKDINNFKRETMKMQNEFKKVDSDSDKTSESNSDKVVVEKTKKKFLLGSMFTKKSSGKKLNSIGGSSTDSVSAHTYEDIDKDWGDLDDCKPINWTKESKQQAFDLLRIMNGEENVNGVKHTFL